MFNPEDIQEAINNYGIPLDESYTVRDVSNFRNDLYTSGHEVVQEFNSFLVKTADKKHVLHFAGYNSNGVLCTIYAPKVRPNKSNNNYLMCKLYNAFDSYLREATDTEVIASFEQYRDGYDGIIYPDGLGNFTGTVFEGCAFKNTEFHCWVEAEDNYLWHQTRLVSDNVSVSDGQETYYICYPPNEDGVLDIDGVKIEFEAEYDLEDDPEGNPVNAVVADLVTEKEYGWEFDSSGSND